MHDYIELLSYVWSPLRFKARIENDTTSISIENWTRRNYSSFKRCFEYTFEEDSTDQRIESDVIENKYWQTLSLLLRRIEVNVY